MDTGCRCVILFILYLISEIVICYPRHHEANDNALRTEEKSDKMRSFPDVHEYLEKNEDNQHKQQKRQSEKIEVRGGIKSGKQIIQLTSVDKLDTEHLDPDDPMDPLIASMRKMDNGQSSQATNINREWNKHRFNQPGPEMIVEDSNNEVMKRNLDKFSRKWPKKIVPYEVNKMSLVQTKTYRVIEKAVEVMSKLTCVQWRPKSSELAGIVGHDNYVSLITGNGCMSDVGYVESSPQFIILKETGDLTSGCISQETILHEMMHVMGFVHEQTRFDRDQYINIKWENVKEDEKLQFQKIMTDVSSPYDLESLMQYGLTDFSKNGNQTMEPKDKNLEFLVDSGKTLSFYDVLDITTAYGCADHCQSPPSCQNGGFVNKDCQCYCPKGLTGTTCETPVTDPDCGGVIEIENIGKEITVQSPSYPDIYPAGKICRWVLKVPDRLYVRLTIEDLHLTGSVTNACYHWLEIQYNLPGQTGMRLCGDIGGKKITAAKDSPNLMILTFDSKFAEYRLQSKGFRLLFSGVGAGCKDDPCVNGRCEEEDFTCNFMCICEPGYTGRFCDTVDENGILTCSFETYEHCFLKNTPDGDSFDWTSSFGITSTRGTGPSGAFKGNMYLFAEMSEPRKTGDKAHLVSSLDFKDRVRCLKFHYHMFGRSMGSLNVYINGNDTNRTELWSKSGNQGFDWLEALVDIPTTTGLKIMIEAVRGENIYSDIALDDVRLIPGKCDHNEPRECLMTARGTEYKGRLNITMSGQTCTAWSLHKKHKSLAGDSNYCRNPDMEELPWCYTATDNDEDWDLCYIPQCNPEECRRSQNGYDYQGTISVTESGLPCQRWDSLTPHQHNFLGLAGHDNYCRNPDGEQRLWCITMDEEIKIDFCDIPMCESPAEECRKTIFGIDYFGNVSTTKSGKTCQRWDSQIPHSHDYSIVEDQENYCRNPNGREDKPWCYTMDSDTETEYCDIGLCEDSPCYPNPCKNGGKCSTDMGGYKCECFFGFTGDTCESIVNSSPAEECRRSEIGYEYKGTKSTTKTGRVCQKWGETSPHSHEFTSLGDQENYCRNPDRDPRGLWCITTDPNRVYDYCDIPMCNSPALECKTNTGGGNDYFGRVNVTVSGNRCQRWDNQTPSPHSFTYLADQENYCRNPDGDKTPWCISTNPYKQWEYCSIPDC